ncbi:NifB/NifX family molybdenum-iron cluster-binding protein [Acetivibrio cellulolyticus]|uniref:NifB/NifX family molybdenum-iron cluster-binding protein n=1 Tax=Acetivibrio cellulolyticus TaxID=35830 RepID=UPI0001E2CC95|nr:hypothetical protein [Acetivibrio cellulolyticus]
MRTRIAIPVKNDKLVEELLYCESMLIYLVDDGNIISKEIRLLQVRNIDMLIDALKGFGINLLVANHICEDVRIKLNNKQIGVICKSNNNPDEIVGEYIKYIKY